MHGFGVSARINGIGRNSTFSQTGNGIRIVFDMGVIPGKHSNVGNFHLAPVTVIENDLHHIFFVENDIIQILNGSGKEAIVGSAPINTNSGSNWQLALIFRFHLVNLQFFNSYALQFMVEFRYCYC